MNNEINLSVVMPTFNEEKAISKVVRDIRKYSRDYNTEILIVDSSSDRTVEIANSLGVKVIKQKPQGHGMALREALLSASGDIIITSDCDDTYPMDYIPKLIDIINSGYDIISCNRLNKSLTNEMPLSNRWANWTFAFIVRLLYRIKTRDVSTGMFCIRKNVIHAIGWETNYSFPAEIIIRTNLEKFRYKEIDIPYKIRTGEVTLNRWRSGKAYIRCFFKYKFNLKVDPKKL